jgi:hypothetical protein
MRHGSALPSVEAISQVNGNAGFCEAAAWETHAVVEDEVAEVIGRELALLTPEVRGFGRPARGATGPGLRRDRQVGTAVDAR